MANFTVVWDNASTGRLTACDATTGFTAEGATPTLEPDFFFQGTNCVSVQVKTSEVGAYYTSSSQDMTTPKVWIVKLNQTNYAAIDGNGLLVRMGSSTTAYYEYRLFTATTYPIGGGFTVTLIDPNVSQWRDATGGGGAPTLSAIIYWAFRSDCNATAKTQNTGIDAIDIMNAGTGLSGTGADTTGSFDSFRAADEDTVGNRWGIVRARDGVFYVNGVLTIGTAGGSSALTSFSDTNRVLVFPHHRVTTGCVGVDYNIATASSAITVTNCIFNGRGALYTSDDTRPDHTVTGTSGSFTMSGCTFNVFRRIDFTSVCTAQGNTFLNGLAIYPSGCDLRGSDFQGCTAGSDIGYVIWDVSTDPNGKLDNCTFTKGSTSTHAIEFDATNSPTTMTLNNITYSGYNASDGQTDSALLFRRTTGGVTVNYSGTLPTYKSLGATITFVSSVTVTLTGLVTGTEVRVYKTSDDSVVDGTESSGTSFAFSAASGLGVYIRIFHVDYLPADIIGYTIPGSATSIPVQQVFDRNKI